MAAPLLAVLALAGSGAVTEVDADDIRRLVEAQRGQVVLLQFWATWCPPCVTEFPQVVALAKNYRRRGLSVVSVSADQPDEIESHLEPFLSKHQPGFPVYLRRTADPKKFLQRIDVDWKGEIPATFFIDRAGRTAVKRFSPLTLEEMTATVEGLLENGR
jgi:thiol-disulfide isomerase/thioredoxin